MKKRLEKYRNLSKEYNELKREYEQLQAGPVDMVADTVKDYKTGYPRTIKIEGYGDVKYCSARDRLARELFNTLNKLMDERVEIEKMIMSIEDPEARNIIRLHYVKGLTFEDIAYNLGINRSTIHRKICNYLK